MLVDCQTCPVREVHCPECIVTTLFLSDPALPGPRTLALDRLERAAVDRFVAAGLLHPREAARLRATPDTPGAVSAAG